MAGRAAGSLIQLVLSPIDQSNVSDALHLLWRGWPGKPRRFWEERVERLRLFGGNAATGIPLGHLLMVEGKAVGVMLTLASSRMGPDGTRHRVINMSSWYVEPSHRWLAPVMLRKILDDQTAVFTDLNPTEQVQRMLPFLGFRLLSDGESVVMLPLAAVTRSKAFVRDLNEVPDDALDPETRRLLEDHRRFGCIAAAITDGSTWQPLLFKPLCIRRLPGAQLVYCERNSYVYRNLGAVARFLLRRGKLLLSLDIPVGAAAPGIARPDRRRKFARGGVFEDKIDYAGSELALFDL